MLFRYQCMSCHTVGGYRDIRKLLGARDEETIGSFLTMLKQTDPAKNNYLGTMPPLAASEPELKELANYLATLNTAEREHA
ncbi:hypothetical protein ABTE36_21890, partial [Acinetobacter baumannii]